MQAEPPFPHFPCEALSHLVPFLQQPEQLLVLQAEPTQTPPEQELLFAHAG